MYELALTVAACLRAGTDVQIGWAVETDSFGDPRPEEALAITPGGGRVGAVLAGAADDHLSTQAAAGVVNRLLDVEVTQMEALVAGLPAAGRARCLLLSAAGLPAELWDRLAAREPVDLLVRLDGDEVTATEVIGAAERDRLGEGPAALGEHGGSVVTEEFVVTALRPVPRFVVVGGGPIAEAVVTAAAPFGWHVEATRDASTAMGLCARLSVLDKLVVAGHDVDLVGTALATALDTDVGYVGAVGGARVQAERVRWLADRGHTDLNRVHAPAGLDIGASSPAEIAVAILAEAIAVSQGPSVRSGIP